MFADLELGRGEGFDEVEVGILGSESQPGTVLVAEDLRIRANTFDTLDVISVAAGGGAIAGPALWLSFTAINRRALPSVAMQ